MKFPWKIVKNTYTPSDRLVEEIRELLFPKLGLETEHDSSSNLTTKFHVDYSIDSNLHAAYTDLLDGRNDDITRNTILKCIDKLVDLRRKLEAYAIFDEDAHYIVVDNEKPSERGIDSLVPSEN